MPYQDVSEVATPWDHPAPAMPSFGTERHPALPSAPPPPRPGTQVEVVPRHDDGSGARAGARAGWCIAGLIVVFVIVTLAVAAAVAREPSWDPALVEYVAFVEAERGLVFDHPVDVRWADISAELNEAFAEERASADEPSEDDPYSAAFVLLGLTSPLDDVGLAERVDQAAVENAGAFYEPWSKTIVLPVDEPVDVLGYTIVHELTHALQDQHGMLEWHEDSPDGAAARLALTEGDADRIAAAWFDRLPTAERDRIFAAAGYDPNAAFEDPDNNFLATTFHVSYAIGMPMVESLVEREGVAELNRLLRSDDAGTTERLIDVLGNTNTSTTPAADALDRGATDGDLGALTWFRALAPTIGTGAALDALVGYDDDVFLIDTTTDTPCGVFAVTFDSASDAQEFAEHVDVLDSNTSVDVDAELVSMEICTPIGDPRDQRFGTIAPIVVLNEMTLLHLRNGVGAERARCAAHAQASTIPADRPMASFIGWEAVSLAAPEFLERC